MAITNDARLRGLIVRLGSQAALARSLGVSEQHVKEILQGRREISPRLDTNCAALAAMIGDGG